MDLNSNKESFLKLFNASIKFCQENRIGFDVFNNLKVNSNHVLDNKFKSLPEYLAGVDTVANIDSFKERYGTENAYLYTLQLIYIFLNNYGTNEDQSKTFAWVWDNLSRELSENVWHFYGLTTLYNFECEIIPSKIYKDVYIHWLSDEMIESTLGWDEKQIRLFIHSHKLGYPNPCIVLAHLSEPKEPLNFTQNMHPELIEIVKRTVSAIRLSKQGDLKTGPIFCRKNSFVDPTIGVVYSGKDRFDYGQLFSLAHDEVDRIRSIYESLLKFESKYNDKWKAFRRALDYFNSIYDRELIQLEDKIIDAVISLEALLSDSSEVSFKIAYRSSMLLANSDEERVQYYKLFKDLYDTRSKIVHGNEMKRKHHNILEKEYEIRSIIRTLLLGILNLISLNKYEGHEEFKKSIDALLLSGKSRKEIREAMGLG